MNVSAIINIVRLVRDPALCLPHASVPTFNHLPVPVSSVFTNGENGLKSDIRAVVLDKDNCFAYPKENAVYKPYEVRFRTSLSRPLWTPILSTYPEKASCSGPHPPCCSDQELSMISYDLVAVSDLSPAI